MTAAAAPILAPPGIAAEAWSARASELASFAETHLVNRTDACGGYYFKDGKKQITTRKGQVTHDLLRQHFAAQSIEQIVGLHTTSSDSLCKWMATEFDRHEGDNADPETNRAAAIFYFDKLTSFGFNPLLSDSNGAGGYHLEVLLDRAIESARVYCFLRDFVADWKNHGLTRKPEIFPKQRQLTPMTPYGNWLRLPGRHPTRDHYSKIWDGESRWLDGEDAVAAILAWQSSDSNLIPAATLPPPPPKLSIPESGQHAGRLSETEKAREAIRRIPNYLYDDYEQWLQCGMMLHAADHGSAEMLQLWIEWSKASPKFEDGVCERKWQTFNGNGGLTIASIIKLAQGHDPEFLKPGFRRPFAPPPPAMRPAPRHLPAPEIATDGCTALGQRDPDTNKLVLSARRTLPTAHAFIKDFYDHAGGSRLRCYAGTLWAWERNRFVEVEGDGVKNKLQPWLHDAMRYVVSKKTGGPELVPFESNPGTVNAALESVRIHTHVPADPAPPVWLRNNPNDPKPTDLLACPSGCLHVPTGRMLPPTPALFNTCAIDFDYDAQAEPPDLWIRFMEQIFGDDIESMCLLQEWFGYCLTSDTSQQKMLLFVGPKRSGKGTVGRIIRRLVGMGNFVGPTTSSLAGNFGLQPLIGKTLAITSDARFVGSDVATLVERLLCISGEDALSIDRKYLGAITMKLATRMMFLTNELPRLNDASGALAGRFLILRLTKSFYGKEDLFLTEKLAAELPGILLWSIEGLKRLRQRGHFVQPKSVSELVTNLEDLASPVTAFVRECCKLEAGARATVDEMYAVWCQWCKQDGRTSISTKQVFGRDLSAAHPGLACRRNRDERFYEGIKITDSMGVLL